MFVRYINYPEIILSYLTGAWIYVTFLIVKACLDLDSSSTKTDIKLIKYDENTIPCLMIHLYDNDRGTWLNHISDGFKVKMRDTGERLK